MPLAVCIGLMSPESHFGCCSLTRLMTIHPSIFQHLNLHSQIQFHRVLLRSDDPQNITSKRFHLRYSSEYSDEPLPMIFDLRFAFGLRFSSSFGLQNFGLGLV